MKMFSHLSFVSLACVALSVAPTHALAQTSSYPNADTSMTGGANNTPQPLPTEPTSAGYMSNSGAGHSSTSWLPYTTSGYVGLSLGNAKLDTDCVAGFSCDDPKGAFQVYTGGMMSPYFGVQLGYLQVDDTDRNGGTTKVSGANIVLLGVAPLGPTFSLLGRVGGTYGWTKTSVGALVPAPSGNRNGFGPSFGAGVSWDFDRNWSLTADWDRHHLKFAGDEKRNVDVATLGIKYRF